jgi:hypothetical protein
VRMEKTIKEDKGNAQRCFGECVLREYLTGRGRQMDESMAILMAGLSGNRMVETGSDSEEPLPGLRVCSGRPSVVAAMVGWGGNHGFMDS